MSGAACIFAGRGAGSVRAPHGGRDVYRSWAIIHGNRGQSGGELQSCIEWAVVGYHRVGGDASTPLLSPRLLPTVFTPSSAPAPCEWAGAITATMIEMSAGTLVLAFAFLLKYEVRGKNGERKGPSCFPPRYTLPVSRARRANGVSSSSSSDAALLGAALSSPHTTAPLLPRTPRRHPPCARAQRLLQRSRERPPPLLPLPPSYTLLPRTLCVRWPTNPKHGTHPPHLLQHILIRCSCTARRCLESTARRSARGMRTTSMQTRAPATVTQTNAGGRRRRLELPMRDHRPRYMPPPLAFTYPRNGPRMRHVVHLVRTKVREAAREEGRGGGACGGYLTAGEKGEGKGKKKKQEGEEGRRLTRNRN